MDLQRVKHALPRHNDALGLFLYGQRAHQRSNFLRCFPLGKLAQPLLSRPDRGVDDFEEELPGAWVEDENGAVDGLGGEVALEGLVDGDTVHVGVIHEPDHLRAGTYKGVSEARWQPGYGGAATRSNFA